MHRFLFVGMLAAAALPSSKGGAIATLGPATDSLNVAVRTFKYRPARVEAQAETVVVWTNEDEIEHTATAGTPEAPDSLFDLPLAQKGSRARFTFEKPGTYAYHCARHPFMRGEIRVTPKGEER